jgi:orotidine-5'-phosphate decarboxylase
MNPILVALDVASAASAIALADALRGSVGGFKIGKQLFTAAGPDIVRELTSRGDRVFLDLKFHDIPNTVAGAVQSAVATGAWMVNVHASGGSAMMQAAAAAARESAAALGRARPLVIAVTVLTSMSSGALAETGVDTPLLDHVLRLAQLAHTAGLDGVVASPQETVAIRQRFGSEFAIVTPGIRGGVSAKTGTGASAGTGKANKDDQERTMTPAEAIASGASYIVVGRPIIAAPDPRVAAEQIASDMRTPH